MEKSNFSSTIVFDLHSERDTFRSGCLGKEFRAKSLSFLHFSFIVNAHQLHDTAWKES